MSGKRFASVIAVAAALAAGAVPQSVEAQVDPSTLEQVRATPKGTIGLGLIGAELGLIIPSAAGLNEVWALTTFPLIGAAGGALAGYFALDKPADDAAPDSQQFTRRRAASVSMLVVGLAGVLPAVLVTIRGVRKERQERWEPTPQIDIRTEKRRRTLELVEAGSGLLRKTRSGLRVTMPGIAVTPWTDPSGAMPQLGALGRPTEMRLSLASGVF